MLVLGIAASTACAAEEPAAPDGDSADTAGCVAYNDPVATGDVDRPGSSELSGLVASRQFAGVLWTHNDGDRAVLIAIDRDGRHLADIDVGNTNLTDWEEIALGPGRNGGPDELYLADTGNNTFERDTIQIVRVPEPDPATDTAVRGSETFELFYGDGKRHDAEAMFIDPRTNRVYIVTKRADKDPWTHLFATAAPLGSKKSVELELLLSEDDVPGLDGHWVGAGITPAGNRIMLVRHTGKNRVFERGKGMSVEDALSAPGCPAPRPEGQFESIAFTGDGRGYYMVPEAKKPRLQFVVERLACPEFAQPEQVAQVATPLATELSGAAASRRSPGTLWAINDGGDAATSLVAFDQDGRTRAEIAVTGADNQSWEDLAIGPGPTPGDFLYIADIGDKDRKRDSIRIYRVAEPALGANTLRADAVAEAIDLAYADGKAHDAEALLVHPRTGDITVITRSRPGDTSTAIYVARAPLSVDDVNELERVGTIGKLGGPVTAAAMSAAGGAMVLRVDGIGTLLYPGHPDSTPAELATYPVCSIPGPAGGDHDAVAIAPDDRRIYLVGDGAAPDIVATDRQ